MEGAKTTFSEQIDDDNQKDWGEGGSVYWEGNEPLNWGDGLQLRIPAKVFSEYDEKVMVVVYYKQDATAMYEDIQLCDKNWQGLAYSVEGTDFSGHFNPRDYYGFSGTSRNTPMLIGGRAFDTVKQGGLIIQGFGVTSYICNFHLLFMPIILFFIV